MNLFDTERVWRVLVAAVPLAFFLSFAAGWFIPLSSIGIGDWDSYFADAWLSADGLVERGWPALWTIQLDGGVPLAGDPQSLSQSPFLLAPLAFGPIVGVKVLVVAMILAGILGSYQLGIRWLRDSLGALTFTFAFVFSGYFAIHLRAGHFPWVMFHLVPWLLLFADRLLFDDSPRKRDAVAFLIVLALLVSGPVYHPAVFFFVPIATIYFLVNVRRLETARAKNILVLVTCAVLITMPRWEPALDWQGRNPRPVTGYGGLAWHDIAEVLLLPIADYDVPLVYGGSGVWEYWSYIGWTSLLLALVGSRARVPGASLAKACLVAALILVARIPPAGTLLSVISPYVPILSSVRIHSRFLCLAVFAIALLAGIGVARIRQSNGRMSTWVTAFALIAMVAEFAVVVRPIWTRVFSIPPDTVYPNWSATGEKSQRGTFVAALPFQRQTSSRDRFDTRMLPELMSGAIVRGAYSALKPQRMFFAGDRLVEGVPEDRYRLSNHRLEFWGDFEKGQHIRIHLRHSRYWKVEDRKSARIYPDHGWIHLVILEPCNHVVISIRRGWEIADWVIACIGFVASIVSISRSDLRARRGS